MTLDEAITQFKYDAEQNRADYDFSFAEDNEQVAEWLGELKDLRELKDTITSNAKVLEMQGYNKAIDDFCGKLKQDVMARTFGLRICDVDRIAEQLKAGDGE